MFYLVMGIIEIVAMIGISVFHSGTITNISGLLLFMALFMIPLANFMAVGTSKGNKNVKVVYALASVAFVLLILLSLGHKVEIPDPAVKLMMVLTGLSSIGIYVEEKMHPGHRHVEEERQDTLR